jgi:flagellar motility protein MotE (MotC chaperone)
MSPIPRLLPLVGVAIVGVLALNALSGARALPDLISSARAFAETASAPAKGTKGKTTPSPETPDAAAPAVSAAAASPLPPGTTAAIGPVCSPSATDLAKSAGLSPAELQVLQSLQTRRGQIDQQSKDLDTQTQLLAAAEAKLDAKLKTMSDLKGQIEALMGQADQKTQTEVDHLTLVYAKMKPADAAPLLATLDDKVRVPLAAQLEVSKPKLLADILSKMNPPDAKHLTELLAHRFAPVQQLAQAAAAPPPPAPSAKAPTAKDAAKPTDAAEADPTAEDAKAKPAPKAKHSPAKKIAKAKPKPKPKAKPVEQAKADAPVAPKGPQPYAALKKADDAKPAPAPAAADKKAASPTP